MHRLAIAANESAESFCRRASTFFLATVVMLISSCSA